MVFKTRLDLLLKLRISSATQFRATRAKFAPENIAVVAETKELESFLLCGILSH